MTGTIATSHDPATRARLAGPGIRAFFRITEQWGLSDPQRLALLGHSVVRSTLHAWSRSAPGTLNIDQLERLSYLTAIYEGLERIFRHAPEQSRRWLHMPRADQPFRGQSPMDFVLTGGIVELAALRLYIDHASGGPPSRESYPEPPRQQ